MSREVEVVAVQAESLAHLLYLIDESLDVPQVGIVRLIAVGRAQLVVVVVLDACLGEIGIASLPVLVSRGRPPMKQKDLGFRVIAYTLGPDLESAFRSLDWDHLDAAGEYVVAAGRVQVTSLSLGHVYLLAMSLAGEKVTHFACTRISR